MASGSFTGYTSNSLITPKIVWSSDDNYNLTANFYLYKSSSYSDRTRGTGTWYITINGTRTTISKYIEVYTSVGWLSVGSAAVNIPSANRGAVTISVTGGISGTSYTSTTCSSTVDIAPPTLSLSVSDITTTSCKLSVTADVNTGTWGYSTDGGTTWIGLSNSSGTAMTATISNLVSNTSYNIVVRGAKTANGTYGTSNIVTIKTLGATAIDTVSDITADADTVILNMTWTEYIADCTHSLNFKVNGTTIFTKTNLTTSHGTATKIVTLTDSERTKLLAAMDATADVGVLTLTTYNSGSTIGSTTKEVKIGITDASAPEFSTKDKFTYLDSNSSTVAVTGDSSQFILNYSILNVVVPDATAKNGATIAKYSVTVNGKTTDFTSSGTLQIGTVSTYGDVPVTVTVTDSRGQTVSAAKTINVINYVDIKITESSIKRTGNVETTAELELKGEIYPVAIDGTAKNSLQSAKLRYKLTTDTSYSEWTSFEPTTTTTAFSYSTENVGITFNSNYAYDVEVMVSDKISSDTVQMYIPVGVPLIALRKDKIGIGLINPSYTVDIKGDLNVSGSISSGSASFLPTTGGTITGDLLINGNFKRTQNAALFAYGSGSTTSWYLKASNVDTQIYKSLVFLVRTFVNNGNQYMTWTIPPIVDSWGLMIPYGASDYFRAKVAITSAGTNLVDATFSIVSSGYSTYVFIYAIP